MADPKLESLLKSPTLPYPEPSLMVINESPGGRGTLGRVTLESACIFCSASDMVTFSNVMNITLELLFLNMAEGQSFCCLH